MHEQAKRQLWQGRIDSETDFDSFRFHQAIDCVEPEDDVKPHALAIVGFECEEGVRRNEGRLGAKHAPDEIRKTLASLPYHFEQDQQLADTGNIVCVGKNLEQAQQELGNHVEHLLRKSASPIILGGGHETLYGHYLGMRQFIGPDKTLGLINIDAHFDIREADAPSSGTMFRQILENDVHAGYLVLGIQSFGNTKALFKQADKLGCQYILAENLSTDPLTKTVIDEFCDRYDYVLLTLCTDSIAAQAAPGVSAPAPFGLDPLLVRNLISYITRKANIRSFDISEVNPLLDENGRTVKLAAYLVAEAMDGFADKVMEKE
ncbi:formimidoylglutamase [Planococcus rifietoensis]|uniref:Formimidoylglutamase n=1 Tax=Planococcus rifietoensis TaxID=200991 RepID=A0A0U2XP97_9BACL|nr:formimidoylglutamase [Planococcus rifietoensis]ALS74915.1 formimidoylglutamase [Planococcus rifietoensis]